MRSWSSSPGWKKSLRVRGRRMAKLMLIQGALLLTQGPMAAAPGDPEPQAEALPAGLLEFLGGMVEVDADGGLLDPLSFEDVPESESVRTRTKAVGERGRGAEEEGQK